MRDQISFWDAPPLKIDKPLRLIELFAGIGAQAKAFENLGVPFEHWRVCEIDKYAVTSYNAVHGTDFEVSDICKLHGSDMGVEDTDKYCYVLTYSFPCQDLSRAGYERGMSRDAGTRSGLLWQVERILREMDEKPQILFMENVPQVISKDHIDDFREWIMSLIEMGYTSEYALLNAKDYGIPQNRERCYMVSWQGEHSYDFPEPIPLTKSFADYMDREVDERYYLDDHTCEINDKHYRRHKALGHGFGWEPIALPDSYTHTHTHTHTRRYTTTLLTKADRFNSIYLAVPVYRQGS